MKIQVLIENTASDPSLACEHGLSLYIETHNVRLLFDTGASGAFADNARSMGVDLAAVDAFILSHGHYDHGGGIETFLQCNDHAPVYLSSHAFGAYHNASGVYIGLDEKLRSCPRLRFVDTQLQLFPGIWLDSCAGAPPIIPTESCGLQVLEDGVFRPDAFEHELYLMVREAGRRICFSGCAHRGVENIIHWLQPDVLIGGFHFKGIAPGAQRLDCAAQAMLEQPCHYYTCHCTGQAQYQYLKQSIGDRLHSLSTGDTICLPGGS